jgi:hypothetical protein
MATKNPLYGRNIFASEIPIDDEHKTTYITDVLAEKISVAAIPDSTIPNVSGKVVITNSDLVIREGIVQLKLTVNSVAGGSPAIVYTPLPMASSSNAGGMSIVDKQKLDSILTDTEILYKKEVPANYWMQIDIPRPNGKPCLVLVKEWEGAGDEPFGALTVDIDEYPTMYQIRLPQKPEPALYFIYVKVLNVEFDNAIEAQESH